MGMGALILDITFDNRSIKNCLTKGLALKNIQRWLFIIFLLLSQCIHWSVADEANATITSARSWIEQQQLYLNVGANLSLNDDQIQTLRNGIPITFIFEIKIIKERNFFFNQTVIKQLVKFQLEYHALSNQYIVTNLNLLKTVDPNIDARKSFPTLSLALDYLAHPKSIKIGTINALDTTANYEGYIKFWLDIESLPTPMQLPVFFDKKWDLQTETFNWSISNDPPDTTYD